jgi:hypothetical protein
MLPIPATMDVKVRTTGMKADDDDGAEPEPIEERLGTDHVSWIEQSALRAFGQSSPNTSADEEADLITGSCGNEIDTGSNWERWQHMTSGVGRQKSSDEEQGVTRKEESDDESALGEHHRSKDGDASGQPNVQRRSWPHGANRSVTGDGVVVQRAATRRASHAARSAGRLQLGCVACPHIDRRKVRASEDPAEGERTARTDRSQLNRWSCCRTVTPCELNGS